jgi:hypothetical protein
MNDKTVYILGAGCSVGSGYPLAKDFLGELEKYGGALWKRANCERLRQSVAGTIDLMKKFRAPTIDRLARRIDSERERAHGATPAERAVYLARVLDAKIATVAMFLDREAAARETGLPRYEDFLADIFDGRRDLSVLKTTSCRVLNFNYDRLFEIAFSDYFRLDPTWDCYHQEFLNSGFDFFYSGQKAVIAPDHFCFLKLHGTAGIKVTMEHGQPKPLLPPALHGSNLFLDDGLFWPPHPHATANPGSDPEPLIVFPHEKEMMRESETSHACSTYIEGIWAVAEKLTQEAKQIWVVGYSFDPNDRMSMMDLLQQKPRTCDRDCDIIVQNPAADGICNELALRYPDLASRLKPLTNSF